MIFSLSGDNQNWTTFTNLYERKKQLLYEYYENDNMKENNGNAKNL
jgi:hypothetical protein